MVDRETVRRGFDEVAETFAAKRRAKPGERAALDAMLAELPPSPRVLDAGCGQGTPILAALAAAGAEPIGLDAAREQLRLAAEAVPAATLLQGDLTALPLPAASVEGVVCLHTLFHLPQAAHGHALAEFARVLEPGGRLLLSEGVEPWQGSNPDWLDAGATMQWDIAGADATRERLRAAGFTILDESRVAETLSAESEGEWTLFSARYSA